MKKKIKDLTFFDVNDICLKAKDCDECPLHIPERNNYRLCLISQLYRYAVFKWSDIIEQEVEI